MAIEFHFADAFVTGNTSSPSNALGAQNGTFTTDANAQSWTGRWSMTDPINPQPNGEHTIRLRVRKEAGTNNPTLDSVAIYEGTTQRVLKTLDLAITNTTGQDVDVVLTEAEIRLITDMSNLQVEIVTTGAAGNNNNARSAVQLDSIRWFGDFSTPSGGVEETDNFFAFI